MKRFIIFYFVYLKHVSGYVFPTVPKCYWRDSDCLTSSFQKALPIFLNGIPELGIDKMDVLTLEDNDYEIGGLKFSFKDAKYIGLKNIIFDKVSVDLQNNVIEANYHTTSCSLAGKYKATGKITVLPFEGNGLFKMAMRNVVFDMKINYDDIKKDGKEYMMLKNYDLKFDVKDYAHSNFTNLFKGNDKLGETVLEFINTNWRLVFNEFGKPVIDQATKQVLKNVIKYLSASPKNEISLG